jgi:branched-chain amino acid transport system permease protein
VSLGLLVQVLVVGLSAGAVYGLVAIGFVLVYRLTGVLQFAHGELVAIAAFAAILLSGTRLTGSSVAGSAYALSAAGAVALGALAAVAIYLGAVLPFARRRAAIGWIGATVAVAFAVQASLAAAFPREAYVAVQPRALSRAAPVSLPGGATVPLRALIVLGVGVLLALLTRWLLARTTFGYALTAIASEPDGARLAGLPVDRLVAFAFALSGALAAAAGLAVAPGGGTISPQTGALLGLKAIAAALLGGFVSIDRVFVAALGIGVLESAVTSLHVPGLPSIALGPAWHDIAPLMLVLVVLAFRPPRGAREAAE